MTIPEPASTALATGPAAPALLPVVAAPYSALITPKQQRHMDRYSEQALEGMAASTLRGVRADWALYLDWCLATHTRPLKEISAQLTEDEQADAEAEALRELKAFFVNAIARGLRRSTLDRYLYTIRLAHKAARVPDPTTLPGWKPIWKGLVKALAKDGRNRKQPAAPLPQAAVAAVVSGLEAPATQNEAARLRELRDMALLCLASDTLARREELARVQVHEIKAPEPGKVLLEIPSSKTDQAGHGLLRHVSAATLAHIDRWKAAAQIEKGPLFRAVRYELDKTTKPVTRRLVIGARKLADKEVARIFKRRMEQAGLDATHISGHSTRIGSTHDLHKRGFTGVQIAQAAGWANEEMVNYYCRELATNESAMALSRLEAPLPAPGDVSDM
jgi:integrase